MAASNGRFLLGVLVGVVCGAGLFYLVTGSQPSYADESVGLTPGGVTEAAADSPQTSASLELPAVERDARRTVDLAAPTVALPLGEEELAALVDGVSGTQASAASGTGRIWGRVVNADGAGLEGVVLRLSHRPNSSSATPAASVGEPAPELDSLEDAVREAAERFQEARARRREVRTDAGGAYHFEGLGEGPWAVAAYLEGHQVQADTSSWSVVVGSEIDFTATRVVEVPVKVFEPTGALANEARFSCKAVGRDDRAVSYGWTAAESFLRLTPGDYELTAYSGDGRSVQDATRRSEPQEISVAADGSAAALRFDLTARLAIRGVVKAAKDGVNVDYFDVRLMPLSAQQEVDLELLANASQRDGARPGTEFAFTDLEPGRYVVGVRRSWNSPVAASEVVELGTESVRLSIELPPVDRSRHLTVLVHSPEGKVVDDVNFSVGVKTGRRNGSSGVQGLRDEDGAYLLSFEREDLRGYFDEPESSSEYTLHVTHEGFGDREVALVRGQTDLSVVFSVPASLEVTVLGYEGSGYEGRLAVVANKKGTGTRTPMYFGQRRNGMSAEGVQTITGLEPGLYEVTLSARPKGSTRSFDTNELERVEFEVGAGENSLQMSIPVLYSVRVHWADGKEGATFSMRLRDSTNQFGFGGVQAQLDDQGFATFEDLRAGDYLLSTWGGSVKQMRVTVPSKEVEFTPMKIDALRVKITDESGDLARLGFREGDLIIGVDGEEFGEAPDFGLMGKLQGSKTAEVNFLIQRGRKTLELHVTGSDVGDWSALGGQLTPDQR